MSFLTDLGNRMQGILSNIGYNLGLMDLRPLHGLSGLSSKEQEDYKKKVVDAGILDINDPFEAFDRVYKNDQFLDLYDEDTFDALTPEERDKKLKAGLVQPLFDKYYKNEKSYQAWNEALSPEGKQEMLENVLNTSDFNKYQDFLKKEEAQRRKERDSDKSFSSSFIRTAEPLQPLLENTFKDKDIESNVSIREDKINDILEKDNLRRLETVAPTAAIIKDQFYEAIDQGLISRTQLEDEFKKISEGGEEIITHDDGSTEVLTRPGLNHWKAFKDEEELSDFTFDDKLDVLAKYQALQQEYGNEFSALSALDADMQNYIADRQDAWDKTGLAIKNLATGTLGAIMNEVNGLLGLGVRMAMGEDYFANDWLNGAWKQYWDGVDHFNTFDPDEIERAKENGGISPYQRIRNVGDEHAFDYNTFLDMTAMAKFIVPAMLSRGAFGKLSRALNLTSTAGKTAFGLAEALGSGVGIADAYAMGTHSEVMQEGNARVDALVDKKLQEYTDDYIRSGEVQNLINDRIKNRLHEESDAIAQSVLNDPDLQAKAEESVDNFFANKDLSKNTLDTPSVRNKMKNDFMQEELKKAMEQRADDLREQYIGEESRMFQQNHRDDVKAAYENDYQEVARDAADAYIVNATTETVRMAVENALFRRWMFSRGTKANLGMEQPDLGVKLDAGKNLELIGKWQNRVNPVIRNVWGGFESNYLDDVTARFGKEFGLSEFDNYMAKHYDPKRYVEGNDNFLGYLYDAGVNSVEAFGETQSWWDGFIGAGGSLVQTVPSGKWFTRRFTKEGKAEAEDAAQYGKRSLVERIGDYIYNPILQEVGEGMLRERRTQNRIDNINAHIAKNKDKISDINDVLMAYSDDVFGANSGDMLAAADGKARAGFTLASLFSDLANDNIARHHHMVSSMIETLDRVNNAENAEEVSDLIDTYIGNNHLDNTEENRQEAFEKMKHNAERFDEMQNAITDAKTLIDKNPESKILNPVVRQQMIYQLAMNSNWERRRDQILDDLDLHPTLNTDPAVHYGSRKVLDQKIRAQKQVIEDLEETIKEKQEKYDNWGLTKKTENETQPTESNTAEPVAPSESAPETESKTSEASDSPVAPVSESSSEDAVEQPLEEGELDFENADYEQTTPSSDTNSKLSWRQRLKQKQQERREQKQKSIDDEIRSQNEKLLLGKEIETLKEVYNQAQSKLSSMYDAANKYYESASEYSNGDGELALLTTNDILSLDINDLAYMLDPKNRIEYSARQQAEIQRAESELLQRDPEAIKKIKDAATLNDRIEKNKQSYSRISKSPLEANLMDLYMQESSRKEQAKYIYEKFRDEAYNVLDEALATDNINEIAPIYSVPLLKDWYKARKMAEDNRVLDVAQVREDAFHVVDQMDIDDAERELLKTNFYSVIMSAESREDAISKAEKVIDDVGGHPGHLFDSVLTGMQDLGYQRNASTIESRKQKKAREEKARQEATKKALEEERAKAAAESAAKKAAEEESKRIAEEETKATAAEAERAKNATDFEERKKAAHSKPYRPESYASRDQELGYDDSAYQKAFELEQKYAKELDALSEITDDEIQEEEEWKLKEKLPSGFYITWDDDGFMHIVPGEPTAYSIHNLNKTNRKFKQKELIQIKTPSGRYPTVYILNVDDQGKVIEAADIEDGRKVVQNGRILYDEEMLELPKNQKIVDQVWKEHAKKVEPEVIKADKTAESNSDHIKDSASAQESTKYPITEVEVTGYGGVTRKEKVQVVPASELKEGDMIWYSGSTINNSDYVPGPHHLADVEGIADKSDGEDVAGWVITKNNGLINPAGRTFYRIVPQTNETSENPINEVLDAENTVENKSTESDVIEDIYNPVIEDETDAHVESPSLDEQVADVSSTSSITVSTIDSTMDPVTSNSMQQHAEETSVTAINANSMSEYNPTLLEEEGKVVHKVGNKPMDSMNRYYAWMEAEGIHLQQIIDRELANILQNNPQAKVHFLVVNPQQNATHDDAMKTHMLLALEYDNAVNKGITNIHDDNLGGVISVGSKKYLVIGTAGYARNNASQASLYNLLFPQYPMKGTRYGLVGNASRTYFNQNPSERFFVSEYTTEIVPNSLIPGYVVLQTENDISSGIESTYRNLGDILSDESRNPEGLTFDDLVFGIQEESQFFLSQALPLDSVMLPRDRYRNMGNAFVFIRAANGKYMPSYLKPLKYKEMLPGVLKDKATTLITQLSSPLYADRLQAAIGLSQIFYLGENSDNILIGKDGTGHADKVSFVRKGVDRPLVEVKIGADLNIDNLFNAMMALDPLVNITANVLTDSQLLSEYNEAGALQTDAALMHTVGSSYRIFALDNTGKMLQPSPIVTTESESVGEFKRTRQQIPYKGNYYELRSDGNYYLIGEKGAITDSSTLRDLAYNKQVADAALVPIKRANNWSTYILGTGENAEVIQIHDSLHTVKVMPADVAENIIQKYLEEKKNEERNMNAEEALAKETVLEEGTLEEENNEGLSFDPVTGDLSVSDAVEIVVEEGTLEDENNDFADTSTFDEESKPASETPTRETYKESNVNENQSKGKTITFEDALKQGAFAGKIISTIKNKWPDAPNNISELKEFLRAKNVEVEAIGSDFADFLSWLKTIVECR